MLNVPFCLRYKSHLKKCSNKVTFLRKRFCAHMTDATTPADDDLVAMYLTDKKNGIFHNKDDHEELEVLLESFSKQVEEIVNEAETIQVRKIPRARSM